VKAVAAAVRRDGLRRQEAASTSKEKEMARQWVVACGIVLVALCASPVLAGGPGAGGSNNCSNVGTWLGLGDTGFTWMNTITPGANATVGQLDIEWVLIDPTLFGFFPDAVRVTNATGVWEKVNRQTYMVTWMAWGFDVNGFPLYVGRLSGTDTMVGCDELDVGYVLEIFLPGQDMNTEPPIFCANGHATETRMPLVQAICEE